MHIRVHFCTGLIKLDFELLISEHGFVEFNTKNTRHLQITKLFRCYCLQNSILSLLLSLSLQLITLFLIIITGFMPTLFPWRLSLMATASHASPLPLFHLHTHTSNNELERQSIHWLDRAKTCDLKSSNCSSKLGREILPSFPGF